MSKPPLPPLSTPEIPPPPPSKPPLPPESQVEDMDMDLSDEEETEIVPIETSGSGVTTSRKPSQDLNLSDALSSFYSDLGLMGAEGDSVSQDGATISQEATPNATPPKVDSPGPSSVVFENSPNVSDNERSDSPFDAGENVNERRKRKVKDCILIDISNKVTLIISK